MKSGYSHPSYIKQRSQNIKISDHIYSSVNTSEIDVSRSFSSIIKLSVPPTKYLSDVT
jgi:hypothetical protein